MQDFAFLREQVVIDAEAVECAQVAVHDGGCHHFAHFRRVAMALFDFFQGLIAEFEARFVFGEPLRDAGVEVPADVVKFGRSGQGFDLGERFFFEVDEAENYVGNLHAGVVDVILDFDQAAGVTQEAREGVAQDRVANVADVGGFVWIDAGVLDDCFECVRGGCSGFVSCFLQCVAKKLGAVEK